MKKFNIKSFLINHTEKMVFGLFAIISLAVLGKTEWSSNVKSPVELKDEVRKVKDRIEDPANIWPDKATYKVVDFSDKAKQLLSRIPSDHYLFSTPVFHPLNKVDEPRREPFYEPVQALTAKAGLVAISVRIEPEPTTKDQGTPKLAMATDSSKEVDPEFQSRSPKSGASDAAMAGAGNPIGDMRKNLFGGGGRREAGLSDDERGRSANGGPATSVSQLSSGNAARGYRFVAVRGVFPLKQQLEQYHKALHVSEAEALMAFEIADFVLERQTAKPGPEPWKDAEWKAVSIENAAEVLLEASDIDKDDPVPLAMKDSAITMELPLRLIGYWSDYATHPRIKDELLKDEDLKKQNLLIDSVDETANEAKISDAPKPRKRGLSTIQPDVKGMVNQITKDPKAVTAMKDRLKTRGGIGGGRGAPIFDETTGMQGINKQITNSNYLLFRYLDFDVQSGFAYRYRVRLILHNPNFDVDPSKLGGADPNIATGQERPTPWSNISDAAVVPNTVEYFVENVGRDPYRQKEFRVSEAFPVLQMSIFNFDTKFGTWVASNSLKIPNIGAYIGDDKIEEEKPKKNEKKKDEKKDDRERDEKKGPKKAAELRSEHKILDLTAGGIVTKKYFFSTLDVLVDVEPDSEIEPDQHPELKFPFEKKPDRASGVKLMEDALVSTSLGELKTLDSITQNSEKERMLDRVRKERAAYKEVEAKKTEPGAWPGAQSPSRRFGRRGGGRGDR